jgi:pilus assembly protein Flp/PilA
VHVGVGKRGAAALPDGSYARVRAALKRRTAVEMLRSLPIRAYLAVVALRDREEGQAMVEYALLLSLIAVVSIGILTTLGQNVSTIFLNISNAL